MITSPGWRYTITRSHSDIFTPSFPLTHTLYRLFPGLRALLSSHPVCRRPHERPFSWFHLFCVTLSAPVASTDYRPVAVIVEVRVCVRSCSGDDSRGITPAFSTLTLTAHERAEISAFFANHVFSHFSTMSGISCCPMANPHRRQASESGGIAQRPNRLICPHSTMLFRIQTFVMPAY